VSVPKLGRKLVFLESEKKLADHLLSLSGVLHGLPLGQTRQIAYECAECSGMTHNFDRNKRITCPDWFEVFLKRIPGLSVPRT
jgi:hypothetical protein